MSSRYAMEMTQPEVEALLKASGTAIVACGSVEQHGPHLPLGTDSYIAVAIGKRVAEEIDGVLFPFCPIGVTPIHASFPGTLSLRSEVFQELLEDVAASLARHGAERFVILNWHELNTPAIEAAATNVLHRFSLQVVIAHACYVAKDLFGDEAGGLTHGGNLEILPLLDEVPHLVHPERATNPSPMGQGRRIDAVRRNRNVYPILGDVRWIAPTGWYGEKLEWFRTQDADAFMAKLARAIGDQIREAFLAVSEVAPPKGET